MAGIKKTNTTEKVKKTKSEIKKELRKKSKDIDVEIMNITNGLFIYQCPKTNESIRLDNPGDITVVSLEVLLNMRNRGILERLFISVIDQYEDEYKLQDILDLLGIEDLYKGCSMTLEDLDDLIDKSDIKKFEKLIGIAHEKAIFRIAERAAILARDGKFDSNAKRQILEEKLNNNYLFKTI